MAAPRRPHDGAFTPRQFPLDPFDAQNDSWVLDASSLPVVDVLQAQRKVILLLGEPSLDAIAPLLHSTHLSSSLLILATSRVYAIPHNTAPAVRVLRLGVPLASSDSAASRLVAVLQWADRTACVWRAHSSPPQFQELAEDGATAGYLTPPNRTSWFGTGGSSSALPSPASSDLVLTLTRTPPRSMSRASKRASTIGGSAATPVPERTHAQRAFDALFHFLPTDAPDRQLLKHAILVTTMSRPFLTCTMPLPVPTSLATTPTPTAKSKRFSLRGHRSPPPTPTPAPLPASPPTRAHIVHLIPPSRAALIRPLESFCLSFSFPSSSTLSRSAPALGLLPMPPGMDIGEPGPVPRPYVMPPAALGDVLYAEREWTLAELVLCGALDGENTTDGMVSMGMSEMGVVGKGKGKSVSLRSLVRINRAWLNGVGDLVVNGNADARPGPRERAMSDQVVPSAKRASTRQRSLNVTPPDQAHLPSQAYFPSQVQRRSPPLLQSHPSMSSSSHSSHSSHSHARTSPPSSPSRYGWHADDTDDAGSPTLTSPHKNKVKDRVTRAASSASTSTLHPVPPSHSHLPTPPSSTSSSPELKPSGGKGIALHDPAVQTPRPKSAGTASRLPTPPYDEKDKDKSGERAGIRGFGSFKRRKGLFTWIKR